MDNKVLLKKKNPLLLKEQDGKTKPSTFDLPPENHTYGKKVIDDPEPMKHVVNAWDYGQLSGTQASKQKNFAELNRRAISNQVHTAKQQKDFRSTQDITLHKKQGKKYMPIMLPEQEFTYGVQNRPSTPVKLVIGNCYAIEQANKKEAMYQTQTMKMAQSQNKKLQPFKTKSQALRQQKIKKQKQYLAKPNIQQKFKMGKFTKNSVPRTNTNLGAFKQTQQSKSQVDK